MIKNILQGTKMLVMFLFFIVYNVEAQQIVKDSVKSCLVCPVFYVGKKQAKSNFFLNLSSLKLIYYVEYFNTNRSQLKGGFEFYLNPNARNDNRFFFGLGYGLVNSFGYIKGLPDYHISYNKNNGYFFKFGGSDRNLYVLTGISFLNAIDLGVGYSVSMGENRLPEIRGFTVGFTIRMSANDAVYEKLKIGF
ncbi:hypothetical protein ACLH3T_000132 [Flavobacterium psychrophilum]